MGGSSSSGVSGVSGGDKHNHRNISLFNRNICRDGASNRRLVYYTSSHRVAKHYRNPYAVVAKDVLRKYLYIVNIVVIYIILYAL
jgi:hypothetical protein